MSGVPFDLHSDSVTVGDTVTPSGSDVTISTNARRLRVNGAGNVILRYPGSAADVTFTCAAAELLFISYGTIIRNTGTTATGLVALGV